MPDRKAAQNRVPKFRSFEEEAEFWENHSPLDYPQDWIEVRDAKVQRPLGHILEVHLDAKTIDRLASIGRRKGMGPSALARLWLLERLAALEAHEQEAED